MMAASGCGMTESATPLPEVVVVTATPDVQATVDARVAATVQQTREAIAPAPTRMVMEPTATPWPTFLQLRRSCPRRRRQRLQSLRQLRSIRADCVAYPYTGAYNKAGNANNAAPGPRADNCAGVYSDTNNTRYLTHAGTDSNARRHRNNRPYNNQVTRWMARKQPNRRNNRIYFSVGMGHQSNSLCTTRCRRLRKCTRPVQKGTERPSRAIILT